MTKNIYRIVTLFVTISYSFSTHTSPLVASAYTACCGALGYTASSQELQTEKPLKRRLINAGLLLTTSAATACTALYMGDKKSACAAGSMFWGMLTAYVVHAIKKCLPIQLYPSDTPVMHTTIIHFTPGDTQLSDTATSDSDESDSEDTVSEYSADYNGDRSSSERPETACSDSEETNATIDHEARVEKPDDVQQCTPCELAELLSTMTGDTGQLPREVYEAHMQADRWKNTACELEGYCKKLEESLNVMELLAEIWKESAEQYKAKYRAAKEALKEHESFVDDIHDLLETLTSNGTLNRYMVMRSCAHLPHDSVPMHMHATSEDVHVTSLFSQFLQTYVGETKNIHMSCIKLPNEQYRILYIPHSPLVMCENCSDGETMWCLSLRDARIIRVNMRYEKDTKEHGAEHVVCHSPVYFYPNQYLPIDRFLKKYPILSDF